MTFTKTRLTPKNQVVACRLPYEDVIKLDAVIQSDGDTCRAHVITKAVQAYLATRFKNAVP